METYVYRSFMLCKCTFSFCKTLKSKNMHARLYNTVDKLFNCGIILNKEGVRLCEEKCI